MKATHPQDTVKIAKQIETLPFVHKVNYGQGTVEKLFDALKVARNVGLVLILGLLFTAMFLISNTIKITIFARRREIEIMRLVGATNRFIRWPFFGRAMAWNARRSLPDRGAFDRVLQRVSGV